MQSTYSVDSASCKSASLGKETSVVFCASIKYEAGVDNVPFVSSMRKPPGQMYFGAIAQMISRQPNPPFPPPSSAKCGSWRSTSAYMPYESSTHSQSTVAGCITTVNNILVWPHSLWSCAVSLFVIHKVLPVAKDTYSRKQPCGRTFSKSRLRSTADEPGQWTMKAPRPHIMSLDRACLKPCHIICWDVWWIAEDPSTLAFQPCQRLKPVPLHHLLYILKASRLLSAVYLCPVHRQAHFCAPHAGPK